MAPSPKQRRLVPRRGLGVGPLAPSSRLRKLSRLIGPCPGKSLRAVWGLGRDQVWPAEGRWPCRKHPSAFGAAVAKLSCRPASAFCSRRRCRERALPASEPAFQRDIGRPGARIELENRYVAAPAASREDGMG